MRNATRYRALLYVALAAFAIAAGAEWAGPTPLVVVIGFVGACIGVAVCLKLELKRMAARKADATPRSQEQGEG